MSCLSLLRGSRRRRPYLYRKRAIHRSRPTYSCSLEEAQGSIREGRPPPPFNPSNSFMSRERGEKGWPCQFGSRGPASCGDTGRCPAERSCSAPPARRRTGPRPRPRPSPDTRCPCTARPCRTRRLGVWSARKIPQHHQPRTRLPPWISLWEPTSLVTYLKTPSPSPGPWTPQMSPCLMPLCLWPYKSRQNQRPSLRVRHWLLIRVPTPSASAGAPGWTGIASTGRWRSSDHQITWTCWLLRWEVSVGSGPGGRAHHCDHRSRSKGRGSSPESRSVSRERKRSPGKVEEKEVETKKEEEEEVSQPEESRWDKTKMFVWQIECK